MGQSDLDLLLEMGFEKARAELAVKKNGGLQGALSWLEENQDKTLEELQASASNQADDEEEDPDAPKIPPIDGENARSLICNDCGKRFRNQDLAEYHASKTEHTNFSESTEEIAPLTEEEKAQKIKELREKAAAKKALQAEKEKEEQKRNEQIKRKSTRETAELKEELRRKEQIKEAEKKRQEKIADAEAKKRIKAKIEADKEERRRKAEEAKAAREGRAVQAPTPAAAPSAPSAPRTTASYTEARLRLQTSNGNVMKTYPADTTLFEVAQELEKEQGKPVESFTTAFPPKKTYVTGVDFGQTLKEAGCVPSAVLFVK